MIELTWLLISLLLPCLIAAGTVWLCLPRRDDAGTDKSWLRFAPPIGIGVAALIGMLALAGLPPWQPIEGMHWLIMAVLPASVTVALIGLIRPVPSVVVWLLRIVVAAGTVPLLTYTLVPYTWSQPQATAWWIGMGLWTCVLWYLMRLLALRGRGRLVIFVLGAVCGTIGGITIASGYLAGGQYAASLAFVILGIWLAMMWGAKSDAIAPAVVDLTIAPISGWLIYNWQFGWTMQNDASPFIVAGLLAIAPLGAWVSALPVLRSRSNTQQVVFPILTTGILLAVAIGLAGYEAMLRLQESTDLYGY